MKVIGTFWYVTNWIVMSCTKLLSLSFLGFFASNGTEDVSVRTLLRCLRCDEMETGRHILFASHLDYF